MSNASNALISQDAHLLTVKRSSDPSHQWAKDNNLVNLARMEVATINRVSSLEAAALMLVVILGVEAQLEDSLEDTQSTTTMVLLDKILTL